MSGTLERLRSAVPTLSVGAVSADLLRLGEELDAVERAGVEVVHVDVMDGVFCPQLTVGPAFVAAIPDRFIRDVHLMIDEPLGKVGDYVAAGASVVTIHVESTRHPHRVLQSLAGTGVVRGVALNPGSPVAAVEPLLDELELLLVLAVNPGWSGQAYLASTASRFAQARALIADRDILLGVDGGVNRKTIDEIAVLGPDIVVAGSAVFDGIDPERNVRLLVEALAGSPTAAV